MALLVCIVSDATYARTPRHWQESAGATISVAQLNWDALADCLTQFAWQPGSTHLLLLSSLGGFAKQSPPDFAMALAVFEDAASFWEQRGVRFLILIESPSLTHSLRLPRVATR